MIHKKFSLLYLQRETFVKELRSQPSFDGHDTSITGKFSFFSEGIHVVTVPVDSRQAEPSGEFIYVFTSSQLCRP